MGGFKVFSHLDGFVLRVGYQERLQRLKFGRDLKNIRESLGLSMGEAAQRMDISPECVVRIERGFVDPETPNFKKKVNHLANSQKLVISL
jgi:predicted transcriptional regulator